MIVDVDENTVLEYQEQRLREKAAPKPINEEVGFLLRLLGERGELVRAHLRKRKVLKLKGTKRVAKGIPRKTSSVASKLQNRLGHRRSTQH
jgi:hypothetical protein